MPSFGPDRFRAAVGLLSPPYTGMVLPFMVIGVMLAPAIHRGRVATIVLSGVSLNAVGQPRDQPCGEVFTRAQLQPGHGAWCGRDRVVRIAGRRRMRQHRR